MKIYQEIKGDYLVSTDTSKLDVIVVHGYLSKKSYWAKNIPFEIVEKSIANSLCFGLYYKDEQVGFARLVTDRATFAYLADVFILEQHRGKGLSKWMIAFIQAHPEVQGLRRWMLGTLDAHELYRKFGWESLDEEACRRFMHKRKENPYGANA